MFKHIVFLSLVSSISISITACEKSDNDEYDACIQKGIQYYKDIDSYPTLKSENISAEDKVEKTCKNSVVAFN